MNKFITIMLIILFANGFAQNKKMNYFHVHFFGGMAISNFEKQGSTAQGMVGGIDFGITPMKHLEVGFEANSTISPFNRQTDIENYTLEENISQHVISLYTNIYVFKYRKLDIFARGGAGYYWGDFEQNFSETKTYKFKRAIGYHVGAGFHFDEGILVMAQYHIVSREFDEENPEALRMDNLQLIIGYRLSF